MLSLPSSPIRFMFLEAILYTIYILRRFAHHGRLTSVSRLSPPKKILYRSISKLRSSLSGSQPYRDEMILMKMLRDSPRHNDVKGFTSPLSLGRYPIRPGAYPGLRLDGARIHLTWHRGKYEVALTRQTSTHAPSDRLQPSDWLRPEEAVFPLVRMRGQGTFAWF